MVCKHCDIDKPVSAFRMGTNKPRNTCRECEALQQKQRDPFKKREAVRKSAEKHSETKKAYMAKWRQDNKEHLAQYAKDYHAYHKDRDIRYRVKRKSITKQYVAKWQKANPDKCADIQQRRRARKQKAPTVERIPRKKIIERDNSACYICNRKLEYNEVTLDHVIPLSKGGNHTADNLRVCCQPCNSRKGTSSP